MMDTSTTSDDENKSVARSEQSGAVTVTLHPLVIMNISEHITRTRAQKNDSAQIYGAVLGKQTGRHVEMKNSFEVKWSDESKGYPVIDKTFFAMREKQYQEVFQELDYVGWYTAGSATPTQSDLEVHEQFSLLHESPILLKLDLTAPQGNKLPITIYESVAVAGVSSGNNGSVIWHPINWTLASEQAERIGIEHVAQISTVSQSSNKSSTNKQIAGQLGAINMLRSRLELIYDYLMAVRKGELPRNEGIIREIAQLINRVPSMTSEKFLEQYRNQCLEVKMTSLVAALTKTCGTLNELATKMSMISVERQSWMFGGGRRTRPFLAM